MRDDYKSGQTFIAYKGSEISKDSILKALKGICSKQFVVKYEEGNEVIFAKIVYREDYSDPCWNDFGEILTVNGYNMDEIERANQAYSSFGINNPYVYHLITSYMFEKQGTDMFECLRPYMHFCSVICEYEVVKGAVLTAGVTEPNSEYTHLYYGYTNKNRELMFSNKASVLEQFCCEIKEMPSNTYMRDGILYKFDGEQINENDFLTKEQKGNEDFSLIKKTEENENFLIDGLNKLLIGITNEAVRSKIEQNIEEYFSSEDASKKISDFILNEIDNETKEQILMMIEKYFEKHNLEDFIDFEFEKKLEDYRSKIQAPIIHIIKLNDTVLGKTEEEFYHEKFNQILSQVQLDEPIMLIGPAGSGKNVAISQVAKALGKHMYYTNNVSNEFKLTGFIDAGGNYRDTEFYKAFKNGGIFFLDEIDNSDPSALIVINSALANGYMAFPHETIDRHPDFRMIAAANTWGKGADLEYVGRNVLDAATLDRFDSIFFDYDTNLEAALYPNDEVLKFMWAFREAVYKSRISHIVSTRGIGKVYKKEINGIPTEDILTSNVIKNLTQDDVNVIIGNMENISSDNKFYNGVKRLRLGR